MAYLNTSGPVGIMLEYFTYNVTGSLFLTLLALILFLIFIAMALNIPVEWTSLFVIPLLLVSVSSQGDLWSILGALLIFLSFIFAKRFIFR